MLIHQGLPIGANAKSDASTATIQLLLHEAVGVLLDCSFIVHFFLGATCLVKRLGKNISQRYHKQPSEPSSPLLKQIQKLDYGSD
jgi:hypothetical protein